MCWGGKKDRKEIKGKRIGERETGGGGLEKKTR